MVENGNGTNRRCSMWTFGSNLSPCGHGIPFTRVCMRYCAGTEPECRKTVGKLEFVKVDDCQSEHQIERKHCEVRDSESFQEDSPRTRTDLLTFSPLILCFLWRSVSICRPVCQGKCRSRSVYSLERAAVEQECVCCAVAKTEPVTVPVLCANGTRSQHTVTSVTACDCLSRHCS